MYFNSFFLKQKLVFNNGFNIDLKLDPILMLFDDIKFLHPNFITNQAFSKKFETIQAIYVNAALVIKGIW